MPNPQPRRTTLIDIAFNPKARARWWYELTGLQTPGWDEWPVINPDARVYQNHPSQGGGTAPASSGSSSGSSSSPSSSSSSSSSGEATVERIFDRPGPQYSPSPNLKFDKPQNVPPPGMNPNLVDYANPEDRPNRKWTLDLIEDIKNAQISGALPTVSGSGPSLATLNPQSPTDVLEAFRESGLPIDRLASSEPVYYDPRIDDKKPLLEWLTNSMYEAAGKDPRAQRIATALFNDLIESIEHTNRQALLTRLFAKSISDAETNRADTLRSDINKIFGGSPENARWLIRKLGEEDKNLAGQIYHQTLSTTEAAMNDVMETTKSVIGEASERLESGLSDIKELKAQTLAEFRNDTARAVDVQRNAIKANFNQQRQQLLQNLQASGISLDSPQAQIALTNLNMQEAQQVGQIANQAWLKYNRDRANMAATYDTLISDVTKTLMEDTTRLATTGAEVALEVGKTKSWVMEETGKNYGALVSDIDKWVVQETNRLGQVYSSVRVAADSLEQAGFGIMADGFRMALEYDKWVPMTPLVQSVMGTFMALQDRDLAHLFNFINLGLNIWNTFKGNSGGGSGSSGSAEANMWTNTALAGLGILL